MKKITEKITALLVAMLIITAFFAGCAKEQKDDLKDDNVIVENQNDKEENKEENKENKEENKEDVKENKGEKPEAEKPASKPSENKPSENKPSENKPQNKPVSKPAENKPSVNNSNDNKPSVKPQEKPAKKEISLNELMNNMIARLPKDELTLEDMPEELFLDVYGIDKSKYSDVKIMGTMINVKANEIILIKLKSEADVKSAVSVLEARKNQLLTIWERYLPDQYEIVKKSIIKSNGKYVTLIVAPGASKASDAFMKGTK